MVQIFDDILKHYTWAGIALITVVLVLFFVQLYYYVIAYYRVYRFRLMRRKRRHMECPPVSVIVAVRGENERFLTDELPVLLNQQYDHYEDMVGRKVVVVTNLKPAKLRGVLSEGMILATMDGDTLSLLAPDKDVADGSSVS